MSVPVDQMVELSREEVWSSREAEVAHGLLLELRNKASSEAARRFHDEVGEITRAEKERRERDRQSRIELATKGIVGVIALVRAEYLTVRVTYSLKEQATATK